MESFLLSFAMVKVKTKNSSARVAIEIKNQKNFRVCPYECQDCLIYARFRLIYTFLWTVGGRHSGGEVRRRRGTQPHERFLMKLNA